MTERTADYWLKKAEQTRAKAEQTDDADAKATLLYVADNYERMAQRIEGRESRENTSSKKKPPAGR